MTINPQAVRILTLISHDMKGKDLKKLNKTDQKTLKRLEEFMFSLNNSKLESLENSLKTISGLKVDHPNKSKSKIKKILNKMGIFNAAEKRHKELGKLYQRLNPSREECELALNKAMKRKNAKAIFKAVEFADPKECGDLIKTAKDALSIIHKSHFFSRRKAVDDITILYGKLKSEDLK